MTIRSARVPWARFLGEFLIIVVGILVALFVDRWNEGRKESDLERRYLESLIVDLETDVQRIAGLDSLTLTRVAAATRILSEIGVDTSQPDGFSTTDAWRRQADSMAEAMPLEGAVDWTGRVFRLEVASPTFDELTSTGNLRVISNPDLRRRLSEYYRRLDYVGFVNDEQGDVLWNGYHVLMRDHGVAVWDWPGTEAELRAIVTTIPQLEPHVRRARSSFYVQDFFVQPLSGEATLLIDLIRTEIGSH